MNYDMQLYELHDICIKERYTYCWMIDTGKKITIPIAKKLDNRTIITTITKKGWKDKQILKHL